MAPESLENRSFSHFRPIQKVSDQKGSNANRLLGIVSIDSSKRAAAS